MILTKNAYGKINLYLDVLNKREDGYHNVKSVMQSVSLCDKITLEVTEIQGENEIDIISSDIRLKCDKSNLIYKAWQRFFEATSITKKRCVFNLEKNIPMAAGMAGGSSDCACALNLLNESFGSPLSYDELVLLGSKIGADVAFCINGGTCICEGIGEKITPIKSFKNALLVCAIDESSVSTPYAFSLLDKKYGTDCTDSGNIEGILNGINDGKINIVCKCLYNKFENVIIPEIPNVQRIKDIMLSCGALGALMSGSGPSVFGIYDDEKSQISAFNVLKSNGIN
ncbi:MAG: 4-(cytidine 5'-diphospho)-2-C-methyl-D-erythritol kinase, partial [Clostridia bacterium]|nr:4-(cytidine 5'-diphospho)-2-C-methyl-D-erythritol kinase [Clostridia bacterium]